MLTQAARGQILEHMGIVRWRLRGAAGGRPADRPEPTAAQQATAAAQPTAVRMPAAVPPAEPLLVPTAPQPVQRARVAERLSVLSLALGRSIMLIAGSPSRRDLRLAMDVLAAASADWQTKPSARRFDWPPDVSADLLASDQQASDQQASVQQASDQDAPSRALEAFVDKDVVDHQARLLLCADSLSARLSERWPGCSLVVVPPLDVLGRDVARKRALWQAIQRAAP